MTEPSAGIAPKGPDAGQLALERTRLAYERTLLAWVRTAVALISFGFTVYKFFQYLHGTQAAHGAVHLIGPREFAMAMIGIGLVALLLATIEHRRNMKSLRAHFGAVPGSLAAPFAGLVAIVGLLGFVAAVFHQ
jgi:putative membrane protein